MIGPAGRTTLDGGSRQARATPRKLGKTGETGGAPTLHKISANARPSLPSERIKDVAASKSTLPVAQEALKAGQESLPDYRRPESPKKFTQPQLVACLVVKEFRQLDYRVTWGSVRRLLPGGTQAVDFQGPDLGRAALCRELEGMVVVRRDHSDGQVDPAGVGEDLD